MFPTTKTKYTKELTPQEILIVNRMNETSSPSYTYLEEEKINLLSSSSNSSTLISIGSIDGMRKKKSIKFFKVLFLSTVFNSIILLTIQCISCCSTSNSTSTTSNHSSNEISSSTIVEDLSLKGDKMMHHHHHHNSLHHGLHKAFSNISCCSMGKMFLIFIALLVVAGFQAGILEWYFRKQLERNRDLEEGLLVESENEIVFDVQDEIESKLEK